MTVLEERCEKRYLIDDSFYWYEVTIYTLPNSPHCTHKYGVIIRERHKDYPYSDWRNIDARAGTIGTNIDPCPEHAIALIRQAQQNIADAVRGPLPL